MKTFTSSRRNFIKMLMYSLFALLATGRNLFSKTTVHKVVRGDTLSALAIKYESSVSKIKSANNLRNDKILIGQKLKIPGYAPKRKNIEQVVSKTNALKIKNNRWTHIVVHHSGIRNGNAKSYDKYHRRRGMKNGLAYHFVIGNGIDSGDGSVSIGNRWSKQLDGGHVKNKTVNKQGIGICLVGNFEKTRPTKKQLESLYELISFLKYEAIRNKIKVVGHKEVDGARHTVCPGRKFPLKDLHYKFK